MSYIFTLIPIFIGLSLATVERAKDNGDIYIVSEEKFLRDHKDLMSTEENLLSASTPKAITTVNSNLIDFEEIVTLCNSSFSIPMDHYIAFNTTAELPNIVDKTGMCFVRCFFEKSGILENWKLNEQKIRTNIWPAMGDTVKVCEKEGAKESNACVRAYAIAKCVTVRALVEASNKSSK